VLLGREVVKEGAFAHIGRLSDVFDRGAVKPTRTEEVDGGLNQALANLELSAFAPILYWKGFGIRVVHDLSKTLGQI
jgi:hypothetical protein